MITSERAPQAHSLVLGSSRHTSPALSWPSSEALITDKALCYPQSDCGGAELWSTACLARGNRVSLRMGASHADGSGF